MTEKAKNKIVVLSAAVFFLGFFVWCLLKAPNDVSDSERRPLAKMPAFSVSSVLSGKFMQDFESFCMDQFPLRNGFRTLKSVAARYLFGQRDVGGIYTARGYVSRLEYPMDSASLENAAARFRRIYDKYLAGRDVNIYLSVIPDKNYFLAEQNGYPAMDYEAFVSCLREQTDYMEYIDIFDCLELSDYYKTDTHWRQEKITGVAEKLAEEMGISLSGQYSFTLLENPFYGVYYGQSALPLPAEQIYYLESDILDSCEVYDYETKEEIPVYDMEKAWGKDPYEMFLSGSKSLLTIRNPAKAADRRLIVFRDSFGSSIAPLLAEGYGEVTLIDIRYLSGELLGNFVEFDNSDVLFLYSTLVLNNSETLK
ncbi:MAG: hypothetical protein NC123_17740 [Butyrivibrio sp.]|nr:hypothetical protein [Acetatifactor muris]MCM1561356.1 hypothetical protein [Butyrivibrio sp.]